MTFWISLAALTLVAIALTVLPLLLGNRRQIISEQNAQVAVLRDRRDEIEREQKAGRLTANEAAEAQQELVDALGESLATSDSGKTASTVSGKTSLVTAALMVVCIPVLSYLAYAMVGQPDIQAQLAASQSDRAPTPADVNNMIAQIEARLAQQPDDGEAWYALAQARKFKGDLAGAVQAYQRANETAPGNPTVMADYAEAIALTRNRDFGGQPQEILRRAHEIAPQHPKVNALLGASLYQQGKQQEALPFLKNFVSRIDPQSEQAGQINRIIAGIEKQSASDGRQANNNPPATATSGRVTGEVTLPGDPPANNATLFISARLPSGPRMPFAAVRLPATGFPVKFELSDANAMAAGRLLSTAGQVVIEARISESGQAIRQSGDRYGISAVVTPGDATVSIEINQRVP